MSRFARSAAMAAALVTLATPMAGVSSAQASTAGVKYVWVKAPHTSAYYQGGVTTTRSSVRATGALRNGARSHGTAKLQGRIKYTRTNGRTTTGSAKTLARTSHRTGKIATMKPTRKGMRGFRAQMRACNANLCSRWVNVSNYTRL